LRLIESSASIGCEVGGGKRRDSCQQSASRSIAVWESGAPLPDLAVEVVPRVHARALRLPVLLHLEAEVVQLALEARELSVAEVVGKLRLRRPDDIDKNKVVKARASSTLGNRGGAPRSPLARGSRCGLHGAARAQWMSGGAREEARREGELVRTAHRCPSLAGGAAPEACGRPCTRRRAGGRPRGAPPFERAHRPSSAETLSLPSSVFRLPARLPPKHFPPEILKAGVTRVSEIRDACPVRNSCSA
jgi:hypothetical protein